MTITTTPYNAEAAPSIEAYFESESVGHHLANAITDNILEVTKFDVSLWTARTWKHHHSSITSATHHLSPAAAPDTIPAVSTCWHTPAKLAFDTTLTDGVTSIGRLDIQSSQNVATRRTKQVPHWLTPWAPCSTSLTGRPQPVCNACFSCTQAPGARAVVRS